MKRLAIALFCIAVAVPSFAEDRAAKRALIDELLELIDAKGLTQASFDIVFNRVEETMLRQAAENDEEDGPSEEAAAARKEQQEMMRAYKDRLYNRIDYAEYAEEIYAPLFDEHFNIDELKELLAFYKTKTGQKNVKMLPQLAIGGLMKGSELLQQSAMEIAEELEKEEEQRHPERKVMADLRTIATALEARATDTNEYPVVDLQGLKGLLEPTYVRTMPEKDPWGTPYVYVGNGEQYRFVSAGADKRFEWNARQFDSEETEPRISEDADADIVFQDGRFMQYPRAGGLQQQE